MTLMLIDSASLWYRAYYGMPELLAPDGRPVNAVRGFLDMTARLVTKYRPDEIALCLDGDWRPSWRVELFPAYKENRLSEDGEEEEPDLLTPQVPLILDLFDAIGFPILGIDDYEADDVIATLATNSSAKVRIVTGDRDLFQLVDDERDVKVVYLAKGISNHDLVDRIWITTKYGIPGDRYGIFAMIRGDASDGLPGVRGIGEKGAALLAAQFSEMDELIAAAHREDARIPPALRRKILADLDYAKVASKLTTCVTDLRLPISDLATPRKPADNAALAKLTSELGIETSVARLKAALGWD